jgi:hypothetical protein
LSILGDGAAGFTQLDPGATAWLAQSNANFQQANDEQSWASMGIAGEAIEEGRFLFLSASDGKIYKAQYNDDTKNLVIGFSDLAAVDGAPIKVRHMGRVPFVSGSNPGVRRFLTTDGLTSTAPADETDKSKKLVVGMQWNGSEFLINCLHTMSLF